MVLELYYGTKDVKKILIKLCFSTKDVIKHVIGR